MKPRQCRGDKTDKQNNIDKFRNRKKRNEKVLFLLMKEEN